MTDDIWYRNTETRRETADRLMAGLRLNVEASDPPAVAERKARERKARIEAHDRLFAPGYIEINGRLYSAELATDLGYDVTRPRWTAGGDPEDGAVGDPDSGPSDMMGGN